MKIAFLSRVFIFGGAEMSTLELAKRMKNFHEVKFFDIYGNNPTFLENLEKFELNYSTLLNSESPFIVHKFKNIILNLTRYLIYIFKWHRIRTTVLKELNNYHPDVVIAYDRLCLSYLAFLKNKHFKVFYFIRTWAIATQIPFPVRLLMKKAADKLICVSHATRQALFCSGIAPLEKLCVIHNSIDLHSYEVKDYNRIGSSKFKIIHSGGFLPSKGQQVVLDSVKILKERNIDFHLFLCGIIYPGKGSSSKKYYEKLVKFVHENELSKNVTFVTGKSNIIKYLNDSDILFFPSSSEGLPRSVMEAMILGKPVIANGVGGVTDLIVDRFTGFITRHNEPIDYANYAQLLLNDRKLYQYISQNARNLINTSFNEEIQIRKMNELLMDPK